MTSTWLKILRWAPRILAILFAVLISLFALDVFSESKPFWAMAFGLLMHLIPTLAMVAVIIIAWRWELVGAVFFIAIAALYVVFIHGQGVWLYYLLIAGPPLITGVLYLLSWRARSSLRIGAEVTAGKS